MMIPMGRCAVIYHDDGSTELRIRSHPQRREDYDQNRDLVQLAGHFVYGRISIVGLPLDEEATDDLDA